MQPLILSGGPAVGKSSCGRRLAQERPRGAFVDADDVRQLVVSGAEAIWRGDEGLRQLYLGARNAAQLARNFRDEEFNVVIADVVTTESLAVYRAELPSALVIHLGASLPEARKRSRTRKEYLNDREFEILHALTTRPPHVDVVLNVNGMSLGEQTACIRDAWLGAR